MYVLCGMNYSVQLMRPDKKGRKNWGQTEIALEGIFVFPSINFAITNCLGW